MGSASAGPQGADRIDAALAEFIDRREIPGILAVVTDIDRTVYSCALGMASRRNGIAMAPDTVFRIASMTKLVTSIAVMLLVDDGLVDLDAPLSRYVPDYRQPDVLVSFDLHTGEYRTRPPQNDASIRQLLSHTAGYGYWFLDPRLFQLVDGEPDLLKAPFLIDEPGNQFNYGASTDVLAQLIEPVSGQPLEKFFAQRLFKPLGMRDTSFDLPSSPDRLASVFVRTPDGFTEQATELAGPAPRGGGGLYSTADDYCRLMRLLLNKGECRGKRLLSVVACNELTRNQIGDLYAHVQTTAFRDRSNDFIFMSGTQKYSLGLAIETTDQPCGRPAGSASWGGIFNTYYWIDFTNEFAATVLMQVRPFSDEYCVEAYRRFERGLYDCLKEA